MSDFKIRVFLMYSFLTLLNIIEYQVHDIMDLRRWEIL